MKHPVANITVEGQGWNPYAVVAEGKEAFSKRVEDEGHYQRLSDGMSTTSEQRAEIAGTVFEKASAYAEKHPSASVTTGKKEVKAEPKKEETKK